MTYLAGQRIRASQLNDDFANTYRVLARAARITTSTSTTTTIGVLRIDDIPVSAGKLIQVKATVSLDSSVNDDVMRPHIRYTADGSTPTTSSAFLPGSAADGLQHSAAWGESRICQTFYVPSADEILSILLCITRNTGTGNATIFANGTEFVTNMLIEDLGFDPGDVGVDI